MDATKYRLLHKQLTDDLVDRKRRYTAGLELFKSCKEPKNIAELAASDLPSLIKLMKRSSADPILSQITFDYIFTIAQKKGFSKYFLDAKLLNFCLTYIEQNPYRLRTTHMIMTLLEDKQLQEPFVNLGLLDALLKYSDFLDKGVLNPKNYKPEFLLKARKFVILSLETISERKEFRDFLIDYQVLEKVKHHCLKLTISDELSRVLPTNSINEIRGDENALHKSGLEILFHLLERYENYGRMETTPREKEIKYLYDYEMDHEAIFNNKAIAMTVSPKKKEEWLTSFAEKENAIKYRKLLEQITGLRLVEDILEAAVQPHPTPALHGLRILYRLCSVLHMFLTAEHRIRIIHTLLSIATRYSGQRRHNSFSCLMVLARQKENSKTFVSTRIFHEIFFLGMEESGDVLNILTKVIRALSAHSSTAEELSRRSMCPKLLVKIIYEDFKNKIEFPRNGTLEEKLNSLESTPALALLTVFNLLQKSNLCGDMFLNAGAVGVLERLAQAHPADIIGMYAVTSITRIAVTTGKVKIPRLTISMSEILFNMLECCLENKDFKGIIFTTSQLALCLQDLARLKINVKVIGRGLPLLVKIYFLFCEEFGKKKYPLISLRTLQYTTSILQLLCRSKAVLLQLILLGDSFITLLEAVHLLVCDKSAKTVFDSDSETVIGLEFVLLCIADEKGLCEDREKNGDEMRRSSKVCWKKIVKSRNELKIFIESNRMI